MMGIKMVLFETRIASLSCSPGRWLGMVFVVNRLRVLKRTFAGLPKDWIKTAQAELKGAPLEELTWKTPEVENVTQHLCYLSLLLGNRH